MVRFILVCMAVVLTTMIATSAQIMMGGIDDAREGVIARNNPQDQNTDMAAQPSGPSFEEIYANAPAPAMDNMTPEQLNAIATASGGNDFSTDTFTNTAPAGLEDVPQPAIIDNIVVQEGDAN